jgi:hypothetical protein
MRRLLLLALWTTILLGTTAATGHAAEKITVAQLEARIAVDHNLSDGKIAAHLSVLELTERLSTIQLQRMEAGLPGKKSRQALIVLADFSAFLAPPPSEIPDQTLPSQAKVNQIAGKAVQYLIQVIPALPNYLATRVTNRFESTPTSLNGNGGQIVGHPMHFDVGPAGPVQSDKPQPSQPMHWAGITYETVTVRDGREFAEEADSRKKKIESNSSNLVSEGEFGTVLIGLVTDAFRGKVMWSHWETRDSKPVAVFRYSVSQKDSHFAVYERKGRQHLPVFPAYHGEIAIDPDQGTILRLTMQGEWKPGDLNVRSDIFVEFAPVEIGGKTYYCPSRSIVLSVLHPMLPGTPLTNGAGKTDAGTTQTELNDVRFSDYHRFRAEMRILTDDVQEPAAEQPKPKTSNLDHGPGQ